MLCGNQSGAFKILARKDKVWRSLPSRPPGGFDSVLIDIRAGRFDSNRREIRPGL